MSARGIPADALPCTVALFVPADRPERYAKARAAGADAVIVDLEDAVAADRKAIGRANLRAALIGGFAAIVRINAPRTAAGEADLDALAGTRPRAIMIAKAGGRADVAAVSARLPDTPLIALIESIAGMQHIEEIAAGVDALAFGAYDFCAELGARPTPEVLAAWRSRVVLSARAAGARAIDAPYARLDDEPGLRVDAARAVDFGFDGKLAIHPAQVGPIRSAFVPAEAELARARAIVAAASGAGITVLDGTMIDRPIMLAAQRVVARGGSGPSSPDPNRF